MNRIVLVSHIPEYAHSKTIDALHSVIHDGDVLIGVDGGAALLLAAGHTPHVVIGDFDSLAAATLLKLRTEGVSLLEFSRDKDATDLELSILYALERPERDILVVTRSAGRPDHAYANMLLLSDPRFQKKQIEVQDGDFRWHVVHGPAQRTLESPAGALLSVIPISDRIEGLTIAGARWELQEATIERGSTRCVSNEFTGATCRIAVGMGTAIVLVGVENNGA